MDGRGKQKIKWFALGYAFGAAVVVAAVLLGLRSNHMISAKQASELTVRYAQMEQEIIDTTDYYDRQRDAGILILGSVSLALYLAAGVGAALWYYRRRQADYVAQKENFEHLVNQLEQFRRGNYEIPAELFCYRTALPQNEQWRRLENKLRESGYHFLALTERLATEEHNTKSLITDISHQLKTPFAALKMSFELSQEKNLTSEEQQEFMEKEKQEIAKLESLLGELVKLSRLESHMIQVKKSDSTIQSLITEAINQVFLKAHNRGIELCADIAEDILVQVDEKWTIEALVNVLDNAVKYSPDGSKVEVHVSHLPNLVLIEVDDEGIGIPPDELHKIFQRFYRGEAVTVRTQEGAGVGLYLARRIIEEQGGTISAKRKARGTTFRITLPL